MRVLRRGLFAALACLTILSTAAPLHAQETDQPPAPQVDIQQLIDQAKQGQVPPTVASSPLPQEATISQLRELLDALLAIERQRELLGDPSLGDQPDPSISAVQLELLTREYNENVLPVLQNATTDCLVAELGFEQAIQWARQVQELGLGDTPEDTQVSGGSAGVGGYGPLAPQLANVQALFVQSLKFCDKQIYEDCLRDDGDPNGAFLGGISRQLGFLDNDLIYQQRFVNCEYGWHGNLTIHEELSGSTQPRSSSSGGTTTVTSWTVSGVRDLSIDLANKKQVASGTAKGHSIATLTMTTTDSRCKSTQTQSLESNGGGSGDASLRKLSDPKGQLTLGYRGPPEPGGTQRSTYATKSTCPGVSPPQSSDAVLPDAPVSGEIFDTLSDPLTESISGSKNLQYVFNASGTPNVARETGSGVARVPAVPGAPAPAANYRPWLFAAPPSNADQSEYPIVRVTMTWKLTFGEPAQ